jgi:hypothetical protein
LVSEEVEEVVILQMLVDISDSVALQVDAAGSASSDQAVRTCAVFWRTQHEYLLSTFSFWGFVLVVSLWLRRSLRTQKPRPEHLIDRLEASSSSAGLFQRQHLPVNFYIEACLSFQNLAKQWPLIPQSLFVLVEC